MKNASEIANEILKALDDKDLRDGLEKSVKNLSPQPFRILEKWPYLKDYAEYVKKAKEKVLSDLDHYIDQTIKSIENVSGHGYYAKTCEETLRIVDDIIGSESRLIVKAKSMITEEIKLREHLVEKGHIVYETDLGELLIQISGDKPMHAVAPAVHITRERAAKLLNMIGIEVNEAMSTREIVSMVRTFLRDKFIKSDIGISGANVIAADTGAIFLISNEGNIRNTTNLPPKHIVITGVEKIMPTMKDAFLQALVQAGYGGLYPPTYLSIIAGPSSTADIEFDRVYGVHGPKELHLILYDGGREEALEDPYLHEQLYCVKCGRCQQECPIWELVGNTWGGSVYGGPMGIGWTAITEDLKLATQLSIFCLGCGRCKEVCPMKIDIPSMIRHLKTRFI